jgi:two-component system C4-dicarboxylate transport sensor histidine kinase DctB
VLVNLLQNAVQAAGEGGQIMLAVTRAAGTLRLSVTDDGPGVPADLRDTLFQPFVTSKAEGIGLGLAIARDIMRQIGGDLVHESAASGTRFTMIMPAA